MSLLHHNEESSHEQMHNHPLHSVYERARHAFWAVAVFSFFINMTTLAVPLYMLQLFDRVIPSFSYETLIFLSIIAIGTLIIFGILEAVRSYLMSRISRWFDETVMPLTVASIPKEIVAGTPNALVNIQYCRIVKSFLASQTPLLIFDLPWTPFYFLIIFFLHPILGLLSLASGVVLIILGALNDRAVRPLHIITNEKARIAEDQLQMTLRHADTIIGMGMMSTIMDNYFLANANFLQAQMVVNERNSRYRAITKSFRMIIQLLILGVGAYLSLNQEITAGAMIAASILLSKALSPIEQLVAAWRHLAEALNAYRHLYQFLKTEANETLPVQLPVPTGNMLVERVTVSTKNHKHHILENIHFNVAPGEFFAILGASGAGKTTLARVLLGIIRPDTGAARLDGANVYDWNRMDFGRHVGYLPQHIELFKGTIAQNIARFRETNDEAIIKAAKLAGVHDLILRLPKGYQTMISENLPPLSGGQIQRIGLARAVYGNIKLLILDEPNANLDDEGLQALIKLLGDAKSHGMTTILITHFLPLAMMADRCLLLQQGKMVALDDPERIIAKISPHKNPVTQQPIF